MGRLPVALLANGLTPGPPFKPVWSGSGALAKLSNLRQPSATCWQRSAPGTTSLCSAILGQTISTLFRFSDLFEARIRSSGLTTHPSWSRRLYSASPIPSPWAQQVSLQGHCYSIFAEAAHGRPIAFSTSVLIQRPFFRCSRAQDLCLDLRHRSCAIKHLKKVRERKIYAST